MAAARYSSLDRILDILLMFQEYGRVLSVQEISAAFNSSRSSTYRYLQVLRRRGLIQEEGTPGQYRLGPAILALARGGSGLPDLAAVADPVLRDLAAASGESVLLTCRNDRRVRVLASVDSRQTIRVAIDAAQNSPLHVGSFGKLHMAHLRDAEIDLLLADPAAGLDPVAVRAELAQIRAKGYAVSDSEVELGMRSVSAAILGPDGMLAAALTVAGPRFRLTKAIMRGLVPQVQKAAATITDAWNQGQPARMQNGTRG